MTDEIKGPVERLNVAVAVAADHGDHWTAKHLEEASAALTLSDEARVRAEGERDDMARKVFVPGLRRCAKCGLNLITSTLNVADGRIAANNEPEDCLNGCGPMWPVTERDAGNRLIDDMEALSYRAQASEALVRELAEGLRAFDAATCDARQILQKTFEEWSAEGQWSEWDAATVAKLSAAQGKAQALILRAEGQTHPAGPGRPVPPHGSGP